MTRTPHRLRPDARRVVTRLFLPGQEMLGSGESRAAGVVERILALPDDEVSSALDALMAGFAGRHRRLRATLEEHFELVAHRLAGGDALSPERRLLMGSYFTNEYSVEAAALCNPSVVLHPDQGRLAAGEARFVMSVRAIGEGHVSSIGFRSGVIDARGEIRVDDPGPFLEPGRRLPGRYDRELFRGQLTERGTLGESAAFVLDALPAHFTLDELDRALADLGEQVVTHSHVRETVEHVRSLTVSNYDIDFPPDSAIAERVLLPMAPSESHGMEDARFVRFVDDDGSVTYYATYTAFDGVQVLPKLLETADFCEFRITQLTGPAAKNKGLALFPRRIGGRYVALSRWDRERNSVVSSPDGRSWEAATTVQSPERAWELLQLGNCGSPIETPDGWLVLTHGVGPMRVYSVGAILLDLDDPTRMLARLPAPFFVPDDSERDGYVPNVVYSCGALLHEQSLMVPYGISDAAIGIAVVQVGELLDRLRANAPMSTSRFSG
ncbi:MAG TPA: glycoside hydrolase family 130 protein [Acidimicrobiia bacterium]|nr:glycoside hydrolase family 130 protein [Acidimicrobiia bacterium]